MKGCLFVFLRGEAVALFSAVTVNLLELYVIAISNLLQSTTFKPYAREGSYTILRIDSGGQLFGLKHHPETIYDLPFSVVEIMLYAILFIDHIRLDPMDNNITHFWCLVAMTSCIWVWSLITNESMTCSAIMFSFYMYPSETTLCIM